MRDEIFMKAYKRIKSSLRGSAVDNDLRNHLWWHCTWSSFVSAVLFL